MRAAPDGHTLLSYGTPLWLSPLLRSNVPWDAVRDFTPITWATNSPNVLVVHPSVAARTVRELIALAKAKPGDVRLDEARLVVRRIVAIGWLGRRAAPEQVERMHLVRARQIGRHLPPGELRGPDPVQQHHGRPRAHDTGLEGFHQRRHAPTLATKSSSVGLAELPASGAIDAHASSTVCRPSAR